MKEKPPLDIGISHRDWLIGLAVNGVLSNSDNVYAPKDLADLTCEIADAILAKGKEKRDESNKPG